MKNFIPNMYQESIYTIPYTLLKKRKIKCLLFDLDNTCVGWHDKKPNQKLKDLFNDLTNQGFKVIIFSNSPQKRLQQFRDLNVVLNYSSKKPFKHNFMKILKKYKLQKSEVCIIGDQLFTDILGGNRVGIVTCLVEPLTKEDFIFTKISRKLEGIIFEKMKKKGILIKGEFYE